MRLDTEIVIGRAADRAFEVLSNFERNPEWQGGMQSARWTTEPPLRVGSRYVQVARFLGRRIDSSFVVTRLEPGRSVTIETEESTFPIRVTRSVEPVAADRCRVRAVVEGDPSGIFALAGPLMRWMVARSVRADYRRLKALLEE